MFEQLLVIKTVSADVPITITIYIHITKTCCFNEGFEEIK